MSRIGSKPIPVPSGVKVDIKGTHVKVTGPKGTLERDIRSEVEVVQEGEELLVKCTDESKRTNAFSSSAALTLVINTANSSPPRRPSTSDSRKVCRSSSANVLSA